MIIIKNRQRKIVVNCMQLERDAQLILEKLDYAEYDLSILITNDATMRLYNRAYRAMDRPTDVLSFPFYENLKAGARIKPRSDEERILGDLIIDAPYVVRAAQRLHVTFEQRMRELLVHGVFHLLGYDHLSDADYKRMATQEKKMLRCLAEQI